MTQIQIKEKKMAGQFWKKDSSVRPFSDRSVVTIVREMPKIIGKNPDKMCQ